MPGDALVEAEVPEEPEGGGQSLLAVPTFVLEAVELWERHGQAVRNHGTILRLAGTGDNEFASWG